jgi:hypothetical protein
VAEKSGSTASGLAWGNVADGGQAFKNAIVGDVVELTVRALEHAGAWRIHRKESFLTQTSAWRTRCKERAGKGSHALNKANIGPDFKYYLKSTSYFSSGRTLGG